MHILKLDTNNQCHKMLTCSHKSNYSRPTRGGYESYTVRSMAVKELLVMSNHLQRYLTIK